MKAVKHYLSNPAQMRKAVMALVSCVVLAVGAHLLPAVVGHWLEVAQPLLVAYGVYKVPNDPSSLGQEPAAPAAPAAPEAPAAPPAA